jgi:RNA polymerase sigma factor (sigma-70 family)
VYRYMAESVLIATLGSKPQLVTLALDCLREMGEVPKSLRVIHASKARPETRNALEKIVSDIQGSYPRLDYKPVELQDRGGALGDITSPEEVQVAFRTLYAQVRATKLDEKKVHLLIAGGRRTLTVAGMATAQMLFDDEDRLWHLASHPDLEASGRLHAGAGEWCRLIPIPVIAWGRLSPVFDALRSVDDPFEAARRLSNLRLREQWDQARIFVLSKLSPAEQNVVKLLVKDGLRQNEIADILCISARTVEQHLRSAYQKAEEHWDLENVVNQTQLVRLLGIYFTNEIQFEITGNPE